MKKYVFVFCICIMSLMVNAQYNSKKPPTPITDNATITKSKKAEGKQIKDFRNHRKYSSTVHNHRAKAQKKGKG